MSTFGRGLRIEMKRIAVDYASGSGYSTILSVPNNANYFIFINCTMNRGGSTGGMDLRTRRFQYTGSGGSTGLADIDSWSHTTGGSIRWLDYGFNVVDDPLDGSADGAAYHKRIIVPGGDLQVNRGAAVGQGFVWYSEVYFGGQSNY